MMKFHLPAIILCLSVSAAAQTTPENRTAQSKKPTVTAVKKSGAQPAALNKEADDTLAKKVIEQLEAWDTRLESLKADFTQEINYHEAGLKQSVAGSLQYVKPNFLRIEHSKPASQVVVTDKTDIWIYKPADKQAVRTTWDAWRRTQDQNFSGILDFGNYSALAAKNNAAVTEGGTGGLITVLLTPRSGAGYALTLRLSATDYFPLEAALTVDGTVITTRLLRAEKNGAIAKEVFVFSPPKGTEVLELRNK